MALYIVLNWCRTDGTSPLRMPVLGTAGSSKNPTIRTIVTISRAEIELYDLVCIVEICANTGVAATIKELMGRGGGGGPYVHYL